MINEVKELITRFNLQPHPEGGYYARTFQSAIEITLGSGEVRRAGTAIHYLLSGEDFSAFHKLKSDEIWYFHRGDFLKIYVLNEAAELQTYLLGDTLKNSEAQFQVQIQAGDWFAAEVVDKSSYCFVSCSVAPGFEFGDFKMAIKDELVGDREIVERLTRA